MLEAMLETDMEILDEMQTNTGEKLRDLTFRNPVMLVFLRHFGCVFCKEAMHDISLKRKHFEEQGFQVVFIHMADYDTADSYFEKFKLKGITHITDPEKRFYRAFGLLRGTFNQLYGLQTWIRGFQVKRELDFELELAKKLGDSTQMPGVFILMDGEVKEKFIHRHAAERPDYEKLLNCCVQ